MTGAKPGELVAKCVGRTKEAPRPEGERQYSSLRGKLLAKGQVNPDRNPSPQPEPEAYP